jgi:hypothetical protein
MTDEYVNLKITSSDGGLENNLKITKTEDLQVAVEQLELAARYQFGEEFTEYFGPDQETLEDELEDLRKLVKDLSSVDGKRFDEIEERLDSLRDYVGKGLSEFQEMKAKIEELENSEDRAVEELLERFQQAGKDADEGNTSDVAEARSDEESTVESGGHEDQSEAEAESGNTADDLQEDEPDTEQDQEADEEDDEAPDLGSKTIPEIVEEQLIEVESPPYSYDEFKDVSYTEQQAAIYAQLLRIQPATKEEVTDAMIEGEPENAEVQYIYQRLDDMSTHIDKKKRPSDSPRDPFEYAEAGFDFEDESDQAEQDVDAGEGEETQRELDIDKSQLPDDSQDDGDEADSDEEPEKGDYGFEWMTIDEAVEKYKSDKSTKFLLCIRSMKSYTSPMLAENHAEEGEGEVWAVTDEHPPDEFIQ